MERMKRLRLVADLIRGNACIAFPHSPCCANKSLNVFPDLITRPSFLIVGSRHNGYGVARLPHRNIILSPGTGYISFVTRDQPIATQHGRHHLFGK